MSSQEEKMNFWKLRGLRVWTIIGAGIIFLAILKLCNHISIGIATIGLTAFIVFTCHGVVNFFEEHRIPRIAGTLITFLIGLAVIAVLIVLVVPALATQIQDLIATLPAIAQSAMDWARGYASQENSLFTTGQAYAVIDKATDWLTSNAGEFASKLTGGVLGLGTAVGTTAFVVFISLIASLWLLADLPKISVEFRNLFNDNQQKTLDIIAGSFGTAIYGWAKSTFICAAINGVLVGVIFFIVGVPYPSVLGLMVGVLYIIPYIGPLITYIACTAVALTAGFFIGILSLVINLVIHESIVNILAPKLMKSTVNVHPSITLIAIIIGEGIGGVWGMLLAVPVVAALQAIFVTYFEARTGKQLYTEDGALFQKVVEKPLPDSFHSAAGTLSQLAHRDERSKEGDKAKDKAKDKDKDKGKGKGEGEE